MYRNAIDFTIELQSQRVIMTLIVILDLLDSLVHVSGTAVTVIADVPHNLKAGERIFVKNVTDNSGTSTGVFNKGYNGSFLVSSVP